MAVRPQQHGPWATLATLTALLLVLAVLQYRWIGDLGRAQAESRRTQIEHSAYRFAAALDRELGRALPDFRFEPGQGQDVRALFLERLSARARGETSSLISRVLVAYRGPSGEVTLQACSPDGAHCRPEPWPAALERFRLRLLGAGTAPEGGPQAGPTPFRPGGFLEEPLSIVVPLVQRIDEGGATGDRFGFRIVGFAVCELDGGQFRDRLLPQLAESHFGPLTESDLVVAVLQRTRHSALYISPSDVPISELEQSEFIWPLPYRRRGLDDRFGASRRAFGFTFGMPFLGEARSPRPPSAGRETAPSPPLASDAGRPALPPSGAKDASTRASSRDSGRPMPPVEEAPWLLVVRHRGGSLDQAIAAVRRRNLAVGLGVLTLLGAAAALLATGAQRARALARQQLEFVASVTHELNTPLAAIRSAGQNLADGIVKDPAQVRRYGGLIEHEGRRLTALVAQVLDFAGIDSGSRAYADEPVSLVRVVEDVLGDLSLVLEQSGLEVSTDLAPDLPEVRGDAAALRRVVANLLTNAAKFAGSGREIVVRASLQGEGRAVMLRVEDGGPGIPAAERKKVFEPFYRGGVAQRNETPGSGLGLSLVRRIVLAHGGRVRIEDAKQGGAAVVVELPIAGAEARG